MMHEIEELMKGADRGAMKAMLRHAAIISDPTSSQELKDQARDNILAISAQKPAPKKVKVIKPVVAPAAEAIQPVQQPVQASPAPQSPQIQQTAGAAMPSKIEYPEGLHLSPLNADGHDETAMRGIFNALSDPEKQHISEWYSKNKMAKSIDTLYGLFTQLKKHL